VEIGKRNKWFLVDREVVSPHTSAFYTESDSGKSNDGWSRDSYDLVSLDYLSLDSLIHTLTSPRLPLTGSDSLVLWRR